MSKETAPDYLGQGINPITGYVIDPSHENARRVGLKNWDDDSI